MVGMVLLWYTVVGLPGAGHCYLTVGRRAPVGGVEFVERLLQHNQLRGWTKRLHGYAHDILRAPWVRECVRHCLGRGG